MLNADIILNNEKALIAKLKPTSSTSRIETFLKQVAGKWEDDRSADDMVNDIYRSRVFRSVEAYSDPF